MQSYGKFGSLLGVIYLGHNICKFIVYAAQNAEALTFHEIVLEPIVNEAGWIEFDPVKVWRTVVECIELTTKFCVRIGIDPGDIVAIGITNQRETTVLWSRTTGEPLCNAIAWNDARTIGTADKFIANSRRNKNILKEICGLPLNGCFPALKIHWLMENEPTVQQAIKNDDCLFGTLDSWLLWNLTGGQHVTDVTNASRTMLMCLETAAWDQRLCNYFRIPMNILPTIKSCSEIFGFINEGPLRGIPIAGCIGDQQSALLNHLCLHSGQIGCTYDNGFYVLANTGQEIINNDLSDNDLLATVAYQMGAGDPVMYAIEGHVTHCDCPPDWLDTAKTNSGDSAETLAQLMSDVIYVPDSVSPYSTQWNPNQNPNPTGTLLGVCETTTMQQYTLACQEATCFHLDNIIEQLARASNASRSPIMIEFERTGGVFPLQMLADLTGSVIKQPKLFSSICMGAMIATAITMELITLDYAQRQFAPPVDVLQPLISSEQRKSKNQSWRLAVKQFSLERHADDRQCGHIHRTKLVDAIFHRKDSIQAIRCSIPGGLFLFSTFAILKLAVYLQTGSFL